ncbi:MULTISPECIES: NAD(P)-dependent oxidoreductase [unclassified Natrinema]|uniref:NAD-dependent epimerase/dehydratase family protein n=1 Tax=unclassified Natrinema TaxID=2622230 RepID=UPI00026D47DE|nr:MULTISPECIES: SDR family oxidoreductase [unclassified Natrinema]AFO59133.1 Nucleoside-diphosphate-sugar epimerase [Natrinema sp. J7-2]
MTVLVTGGTGYLGSLLIREVPTNPTFADETIRILDNFRRPCYHALWDLPSYANYEFASVDIRNKEEVAKAVEDVDTVFHLAAITNASETFEIPEKTRAVNYEGALNVYEAARSAGVKQFVNVSTCSVYGTTDERIDEKFECEPESPYGKAKLDAEQVMLDQYDGTMGLTSLRLGTVYGWTTGMRFDTVVDKFALLAATGRPLTVYQGAENQKRPYLHVRDAVRSMLFAADVLGDGEVYNVVGQNSRVKDVVATIERSFPDVAVEYEKAEHLNQLSYIVSDSKIRNKGFKACHTLDHGVAELEERFRGLL